MVVLWLRPERLNGKNKMKVSELQLGDIVSCLGDPVRVVSLSIKDDEPIGIMSPLKTIETFRDEDVKPVPLTTKILEMNGWSSYEYYHVLEKDNYRLKVEFADDGLLNLSYDLKEGTISGHPFYMCHINDLTLSYVHELQHALRLVGLNDLAKNLKV